MTSIAFTGDISFSKYFKGAYKRDFIDPELVKFLKDSDHVVANVECSLTDREVTRVSNLTHATPTEAACVLDAIGADIWTLANNHIMDCGKEGLEDTMATAKAHGAKTIGAGMNVEEASAPLYLDEAGGIGIFSFCFDAKFLHADENTPGCMERGDLARIERNIKAIKEKCRWCIVVAHTGFEFTQLPMPHVREMTMQYLKWGADIVVCHHPHVVQNYETFPDGKMIFYSLGNFIFDTDYQRVQQHTEYGMLLKLHMNEEGFTWESCGLKVDRENQSIVKDEGPAIFREVDAKQYKLLWPLAVLDFVRNEKISRTNLHPEWAENSARWWRKRLYKRVKKPASDWIKKAKFMVKLGLWKKADPVVVEYIDYK